MNLKIMMKTAIVCMCIFALGFAKEHINANEHLRLQSVKSNGDYEIAQKKAVWAAQERQKLNRYLMLGLELDVIENNTRECGDGEAELTLTMNDSYGDGWNGNTFCINDDCATLDGVNDDGSTGTATFCVDMTAANYWTCGGGSWASEVSWTLTGDGVDLSGGAPESGCIGDGCGGEEECDEGLSAYSYTCDGGSWQSEVSWTLNDADGNEVGAGGAPAMGDLCLADGTYTLYMVDSYGDGWNGNSFTIYHADGNVIASCTIDSGDSGTCEITVGGVPPVNGCTDPTAPEYNPDAVIDDGSCWANCLGVPSYIGDGYCDGDNNNEGCAFDGGDCCGSTCQATSYNCGVQGESWGACVNECLDPNANDDCCADDSCDFNPPTCEDEGLITCWDGSCAASEGDCPDLPECAAGEINDCVGLCAPESWIGDGLCDDGSWGAYFNCDALGCDGGDCGQYNNPYDDCYLESVCGDGLCTGDETPENCIEDCQPAGPVQNLTCTPAWLPELGDNASCILLEWDPPDVGLYDGLHYHIYSYFYNCEDDGLIECWDGSCAETYDDCPEATCGDVGGTPYWIGDGYCDGYNNNEECEYDGGDCCPTDCQENVDAGCPDAQDGAGGCYGDEGDYGNCGTCADDFGGDCMDPGSQDLADGGLCDDGEFECDVDCMGNSCFGYESWIGDGYCDDGTFGLYFNCDEFNCDEGDCLDEDGNCSGGDPGGNGNGYTDAPASCYESYHPDGLTKTQIDVIKKMSIRGVYNIQILRQHGLIGNENDSRDWQWWSEVFHPTTEVYLTGWYLHPNITSDWIFGIATCTCMNGIPESDEMVVVEGCNGGLPPEAPAGWTCEPTYYFDEYCDCGCGVYDPACDDPDAPLWDNCGALGCVNETSPDCNEPEVTLETPINLTAAGTADDYDGDGIMDNAILWDWDDVNEAEGCADGNPAYTDCIGTEFCNGESPYTSYDCYVDDGTCEDLNGDGMITDWVGDGYCDDGAYGVYFNCDEYGQDCGDCDGEDYSEIFPDLCADDGGGETETDGTTCDDGYIEDCIGQCSPESWVGDGWCDDGTYGAYFNCDTFDCDAGDCDPSACEGDDTTDTTDGDDCDDGYSPDCSGDGDCGIDSWIGDGYCDGFAQQWGINNCCYDLDGGDCTEEECEEGETTDTGGSEVCEDCVYDFTAYGAECCDAAWDIYGIDCATLEANYYWDCEGCSCPGDGGDPGQNIPYSKYKDASALSVYNDLTHEQILAIKQEMAENRRSIFNLVDPPAIYSMEGNLLFEGTPDNRAINWDVHVFCEDCNNGEAWENTWQAGQTDFLVYGFPEDTEACAEIRAFSTTTGEISEWTDPACAPAGQGACSAGDANDDTLVNVSDIVSVVNFILWAGTTVDEAVESGLTECSDYNGDGLVNVTDIVGIVAYILDGGTAKADPATSAVIRNMNGFVTISANGSVDAVQMTLTHGEGFAIELTDAAMVAEYKNHGDKTILVIVVPETEHLFTAEGDFTISEVIVANMNGNIDAAMDIPTEFSVSDAYPNPFNPVTNLNLTLPSELMVDVKVYSVTGQVVDVITSRTMAAGYHTLAWDASNLSSGMYFIRTEAGVNVSTQKVMLLK